MKQKKTVLNRTKIWTPAGVGRARATSMVSWSARPRGLLKQIVECRNRNRKRCSTGLILTPGGGGGGVAASYASRRQLNTFERDTLHLILYVTTEQASGTPFERPSLHQWCGGHGTGVGSPLPLPGGLLCSIARRATACAKVAIGRARETIDPKLRRHLRS